MRSDNMVCLFTISGLLIAFVYHIVAYERLRQYCIHHQMDKCRKEVLQDRYDEINAWLWNWVIIVLNIISVLFFCMSQYYQNQWFQIFKKFDEHRSDKVRGFISRDRYFQFTVQVIMLMVSPLPNIDYKFSDQHYHGNPPELQIDHVQYLSDYISAFMFIRFYFLFKSWFNYNKYRDAFSKTICKEHKFYPSNWFILKVMFNQKPALTTLITTIVMIIVITSWLVIFEIEKFLVDTNTRTHSPLFGAFYLTMVTITTVGYGDITPETINGKFVIIIAAIWGIIQISFVVNMVTNLINLDDNETDAIQRINHSKVAAKAISNSFKYFKEKKQYYLIL